MSNASYPVDFPSGVVVRQSGAQVRSDPDGLASATETFRGYYADMVSRPTLTTTSGYTFGRTYLSPHFQFPSLRAYGVRIQLKPGKIDGELSIEYRGLDPALSYPPPPIYSTEESASICAIQEYPLFNTPQMAGTPSEPANGAVFASYDKTGTNYNPVPSYGNPGTFDPTSAVFSYWAATSQFAGKTQVESACIIFKSTFTAYGLPDLSDAGTFSDPDGPAPEPPQDQDWWFVGGTAEDNAGLYRCTLTWKTVFNDPGSVVIYGG